MADLITTPTTPQTETEYNVFFTQLLAQLEFYQAQSEQNRADLDRLKAETDTLKAEGRRLEAENRAILTRLKAMV